MAIDGPKDKLNRDSQKDGTVFPGWYRWCFTCYFQVSIFSIFFGVADHNQKIESPGYPRKCWWMVYGSKVWFLVDNWKTKIYTLQRIKVDSNVENLWLPRTMRAYVSNCADFYSGAVLVGWNYIDYPSSETNDEELQGSLILLWTHGLAQFDWIYIYTSTLADTTINNPWHTQVDMHKFNFFCPFVRPGDQFHARNLEGRAHSLQTFGDADGFCGGKHLEEVVCEGPAVFDSA